MSADRAEFVARLFARRKPPGLTAATPIAAIFAAVAREESSEAVYVENVRAVVNQLTKKHAFVLDAGDLLRLQHDYRAFYLYGPKIQYSSSRNSGRRAGEPTYADLMVATDGSGELRGYLASDESFRFLKQLENDNLIVPLVGNFAGPRAIRAVGQYLTRTIGDRVGVLRLERRGVSGAGRRAPGVLRERRHAAARAAAARSFDRCAAARRTACSCCTSQLTPIARAGRYLPDRIAHSSL